MRHSDVIHKGWIEYMEKARAQLKAADLEEFFKRYENLVSEYNIDTRLVSNFDETMLKMDPSSSGASSRVGRSLVLSRAPRITTGTLLWG